MECSIFPTTSSSWATSITDKGDDYHIEHLGNFIKFLMELGVAHQIQHFAIAFSKAQYDHPNVIPSADITCIRLY